MRKQNVPFKRLATEEALTQVAADLKYPNLEALYVAVGEGHVSPQSVVARLSRLGHRAPTSEDVTEVPLARPVRIGAGRRLAGRRRPGRHATCGCGWGGAARRCRATRSSGS